ncbi:serine hydrolase domain-containing protein [Kitasatospora sp. NPDC059673]|uniref:serine hydrolase domain-containing protein n=1 Tax=Kitasatospora sp. NPDC059673 TaxID=3346901 RepID=UPI0036AFFF53
MNSPSVPGRCRRRTVTAGAAAAVLALLAVASPAVASAPAPAPPGVQRSLEALVSELGVPGALVTVREPGGRTVSGAAGVGDVATGAPVPLDGEVRAGSNTKTFVAVVVLQLVAEGRVRLNSNIEHYLPGLVRGKGIDGRHITVRQLLQQTSGLPNYSDYLGEDVRHFEPRELLDLALRHPAAFRPGTSWQYSNTNYLLAGLLVERVTGHTLAQELDTRIVQRLGLRHTYFPAPGETALRGPHPHGYYRDAGHLLDVTEFDPSWAWAAGQLVSTNADLDTFFTALLTPGRLLPAAQLAQMQAATATADATFGPGARYGLGLVSRPLSCGGRYWGHGGSFPGYETRGGATEDGRAASVAVTEQVTDSARRQHLDDLVDGALCEAAAAAR